MVDDLDGPYWTLAQAVVWMLTRDASRAEAIPRRSSREFGVRSVLERLLLEVPDLKSQVSPLDAWEELPKSHGYLAEGIVFDELTEAVRAGEIKARGYRLRSKRKVRRPLFPQADLCAGRASDSISAHHWQFLLIQSMPDGLCGGYTKATKWTRLEFCRSDVMAWKLRNVGVPSLDAEKVEADAADERTTAIFVKPPLESMQLNLRVDEQRPIRATSTRGPKPIKLEKTIKLMRAAIYGGEITKEALKIEKEESLASTYGVSRYTARKARNAVLSDCPSQK